MTVRDGTRARALAEDATVTEVEAATLWYEFWLGLQSATVRGSVAIRNELKRDAVEIVQRAGAADAYRRLVKQAGELATYRLLRRLRGRSGDSETLAQTG